MKARARGARLKRNPRAELERSAPRIVQVGVGVGSKIFCIFKNDEKH